MCVCFNHRHFLLFFSGDPSLIRSGWFNSLAGVVKRRFASYVKLHLAAGSNQNSSSGRDKEHQHNHHHHHHHNHRERFDKNHHRSSSASGSVMDHGYGSGTNTTQLPIMSKMHPPSPHVLSGIDRRHRSPDPPPR